MEKPSDIPSVKKLRDEIAGAEILLKAGKPVGIFSKKIRESIRSAEADIKKAKQELDDMLRATDKFNEYFSNDGWIAYETMNADTIKEAVSAFETSGSQVSKDILLAYYSPDEIEKRFMFLRRIECIRLRLPLIQNVLADYKESRYYSCVPMLLILSDGIVNDVNKHSGLAAESTDMEVWDSIVGHNSGMNKLKQFINTSRKKTNTEPIYLPYRHGILHGRDINYGNQELAAKCWALLFAVSDWAHATMTEHERKQKFDDEVNSSRKPLREVFKDYKNHLDQKALFNERIAKWSPESHVGDDSYKLVSPDNHIEGTPERAVVEFYDLLNKKNFGYMNDKMYKGYIGGSKKSEQIGAIRRDFEGISVSEYKIIEVSLTAPAISEVIISIKRQQGGMESIIESKYRMLFENENQSAIYGQQEGEWLLVNGYHDLIYK